MRHEIPTAERATAREIAPRLMLRALECVGGPGDGETRDVPADENTVNFRDGSYVTHVITERGMQREVLLWIPEP
jgi:hypothetical protein